jgi:hypothetical protein
MHAMSLPELMLFAFHLSNMGYGIVSRQVLLLVLLEIVFPQAVSQGGVNYYLAYCPRATCVLCVGKYLFCCLPAGLLSGLGQLPHNSTTTGLFGTSADHLLPGNCCPTAGRITQQGCEHCTELTWQRVEQSIHARPSMSANS